MQTLERNDFEYLIQNSVMTYLNSKVENFSSGQLSEHLTNRKCITSDQRILESISGEKIEFDTVPPVQTVLPHNSVSREHKEKVNNEIKSLLQEDVVVKVNMKMESLFPMCFLFQKVMAISALSSISKNLTNMLHMFISK